METDDQREWSPPALRRCREKTRSTRLSSSSPHMSLHTS